MKPAYSRMFANVACSDRGLFVWGGVVGPGTEDPCAYGCQGGKLFDFASETWGELPLDGAPPSHDFGSAVWTGMEWLLWGGEFFGETESGGRYDPRLARWSTMSATGQPIPRKNFAYAWTGSEFLVWGGTAIPSIGQKEVALGDGGAYDPVQNAWRTISSAGIPGQMVGSPTSIWTGKRWLVAGWVGENGVYSPSGAAYDPVDDSWRPGQLAAAPDKPTWLDAVWMDQRALFWGFTGDPSTGDTSATTAIYDPELDSWSAIPQTNGPISHSNVTLAWTGTHVIAIGRRVADGGGGYLDVPHGRAFSVKENKWLAMPSGFHARALPTACWANGNLYLWGGWIGDGDRVDGTVDIWTPPGDSDSGAR